MISLNKVPNKYSFDIKENLSVIRGFALNDYFVPPRESVNNLTLSARAENFD